MTERERHIGPDECSQPPCGPTSRSTCTPTEATATPPKPKPTRRRPTPVRTASRSDLDLLTQRQYVAVATSVASPVGRRGRSLPGGPFHAQPHLTTFSDRPIL